MKPSVVIIIALLVLGGDSSSKGGKNSLRQRGTNSMALLQPLQEKKIEIAR